MNRSDLPDGWAVQELDSLRAEGDYTFVGGPFGSDLTSKDYVQEPGVPVIRGTNLGGNESRFIDDGFVYVSARKAEALRRNMAFPGDVVFTQRGTLGQVAVIPKGARFDRYVISQSQMKLSPDPSKIESRFLYYYFRTPRILDQLLRQTQATGVPHINLGILKRFPVVVPPLPEQRRIAEVLDRAEALRAKRRAALAQLDTLTQSIFLAARGGSGVNGFAHAAA
jgi:type I restriction enzyme, S subunit